MHQPPISNRTAFFIKVPTPAVTSIENLAIKIVLAVKNDLGHETSFRKWRVVHLGTDSTPFLSSYQTDYE